MKTTQAIRDRAKALLSEMTLKEKLDIIIETSPANERLGIPEYRHGNEALHGVVRPGAFTVFPQSIGLAAAFDDAMIEKIADAISTESRARYHGGCTDGLDQREFNSRYNGLLTFWSPDLNIARDPRWGRTGETYGEDPYLVGKYGAAFVRGLQGSDPDQLKAVATPKHFVANNEEHNRFECDAIMDDKSLYEYYLEPFRIAVREGEPEAVMGAYNAINGVPCHASKRLLTDILRGEWGFDGYVVSDCSAVGNIWEDHKYCDRPEDAASLAMNAGVDLECGGYSEFEHYYKEFLEKQVRDGKVSVERIDQAVLRVLIARIKTGQLESSEASRDKYPGLDIIGCEAHSAMSYEAAVRSCVLLKNDGILPLDNRGKILVVGNNAAVCQFGDYSGKAVNKPVTPLDGIIKRAARVEHVGWDFVRSSETFRTVPAACLFVSPDKHGVDTSVYDNARRAGVPKKRVDEVLDFAWEDRFPDPLITTEEFSCLYSGFIRVPHSGEYTFRVSWSGSAECCPPCLTIDGVEYKGEKLKLSKGDLLPYTLTYYKQGGSPSVKLEWIVPRSVDESELFRGEVKKAEAADVVIAVLGLGTEYESEGRDKTDLSLPEEQLLLLRKLHDVNQNVVLVVENGSALVLTEPERLCRAILEAWYPGDRGGDAIADILFGNVSPSGRLPLAFPRRTEDLPPFDDYYVENGRSYAYRKIEPLYDFGYGLSYTAFAYSDLTADKRSASVTVKNTGDRAAEEVVQLYMDSAGLDHQPRLRLRGFKRVPLAPGESKQVVFELDEECFSLFDENGRRGLTAGSYRLFIGGGLPKDGDPFATVVI